MHRLVIFLFLTSAIFSFAQAPQRPNVENTNDGTEGTPITFHVTSVRQEDLTDCDPQKCSSREFTIEGYVDTRRTGSRITYVLTCIESVVYEPTPHVSGACVRLHAGGDYDGKRFADSIDFWPNKHYTPPPYRVLYSIESEKEISRASH
ncbi:MAG: hypothetical protein BGO25_16290 [Acidobacteriales bacterium 59-55]|nr:MAG: hypothetical protein BGO25_16290 [Acidobacteriales bacterium 59-55]